MQRADMSCPAGTRDQRGGFTLIEVLVAFLVIAFGTVIVQQAVMTGLRGSEQAGDRLKAELVARSLLSAPLPSRALDGAGASGTLDGLAWTMRLEPLRLPFPTAADRQGKTPAWVPLRMIVTVTLGARRSWSLKPGTVRLETVRLVEGPAS